MLEFIYKTININVSLTRRYIDNIIKELYENKN